MPDSFSDPTVPRWDAPPPPETGHVLKHQPHKCPYPPAVDGLVSVTPGPSARSVADNLGRQLSLSHALRDLADDIERELRP